jgi:hypothetical protein
MIFVNGKLLGEGTAMDRIDMADEELVFHGSDRLALWQTNGTGEVLIDEFTVWQSDPTEAGTLTAGLFDNGRGGSASAENWMLFE